ncbi:MAG: glycoside hydrolase family 38 C-terminal domain-containing protein, partial [Phycisphaerae bacterium]
QSDTWSHDVKDYEGKLLETFAATEPWSVLERGPLRASLHNMLHAKDGKLRWTVQLLDGGRALRLRLSLNWWGTSRIVKLLIPPGFKPTIRRDGTPGAIIERPLDKREYPIMDLISVATKEAGGASLTVVSPDIYSTDVQPDGTLRLTLLRCPVYSHHDPAKYAANDPYPVTDQGVHDYEIDLIPDTTFREKETLAAAHRLNFPLWISETTKGMPSGWRYDNPPRRIPAGMPPVPPLGAAMPADLLASAAGARLVGAEKLCEKWAGEQLLISAGSTLKLQLAIPVDAKYRLCLSRLAGKGFGPVQLLLDGKLLATLPSRGTGKPQPQLDVLPDQLFLNAGPACLELKAQGSDRLTLGFLDLKPIYTDIPAGAWRIAGPFLYTTEKGYNPMEAAGQTLQKTEYAPEKSRDLDAPFTLVDGLEARWQSPSLSTVGSGDFIDFHALTGHKSGSIHYAVTHLWSDAARTARLSFGLDYHGRIWLNGQLVAPCLAGAGAPYKGQLNLDIQLQKGWNELLLKIASGSGGNGFWMAISDPGTLKFAARVES